MPQPVRVESDEALPERSAVVVIGGGIIGVATALELAERGIASLCARKARSPRNSRAAIGAGAGRWGAIPEKFP